MTTISKSGLLVALTLTMAACGGDAGQSESRLSGSVQVDGSSTVFPITEAVAEEFMIEHGSAVRVTVGVSGTGGGFRRFCAGQTDISNASRPIKESELAMCEQNGVEPVEVMVAYDGLSVVTHPDNTFVECLTVDELRAIWEPGSTIDNWSQVRPGFPDQEITLYGPGTDSGTFDYFTEAVMGEEDASRSDYTASEDDNILVQGVSGDVGSLGYFGYAYYQENEQRLKLLGIDNGAGCVKPNPETIQSGTYAPLARPIYIYVSRDALARPEVREFVSYYLGTGRELVEAVGYIPLADSVYTREQNAVAEAAGAGA